MVYLSPATPHQKLLQRYLPSYSTIYILTSGKKTTNISTLLATNTHPLHKSLSVRKVKLHKLKILLVDVRVLQSNDGVYVSEGCWDGVEIEQNHDHGTVKYKFIFFLSICARVFKYIFFYCSGTAQLVKPIREA